MRIVVKSSRFCQTEGNTGIEKNGETNFIVSKT